MGERLHFWSKRQRRGVPPQRPRQPCSWCKHQRGQHPPPGVQVGEQQDSGHRARGVHQPLLNITPPDRRRPSLTEPPYLHIKLRLKYARKVDLGPTAT